MSHTIAQSDTESNMKLIKWNEATTATSDQQQQEWTNRQQVIIKIVADQTIDSVADIVDSEMEKRLDILEVQMNTHNASAENHLHTRTHSTRTRTQTRGEVQAWWFRGKQQFGNDYIGANDAPQSES